MRGDSSKPFWRGLAGLAGGLVLYFAMPVRSGENVSLPIAVPVSLVGAVTVAWVVIRELRAQLRREALRLQVVHLVLLIEIAVLLFALAYYALAVNSTDQMAGVETRLDALYFAATTMTTVGFGDIHAVGQLARAVVTVNMAFDVAVLAAAASLFKRRMDPGQERTPDASRADDA